MPPASILPNLQQQQPQLQLQAQIQQAWKQKRTSKKIKGFTVKKSQDKKKFKPKRQTEDVT